MKDKYILKDDEGKELRLDEPIGTDFTYYIYDSTGLESYFTPMETSEPSFLDKIADTLMDIIDKIDKWWEGL